MPQDAGFTVTPDIVVGADGVEHIDYSGDTVHSGSQRVQQIDEFNEYDPEEMFYEGEDGQLHHRFENIGELSQDFEEDYIEEPPAEYMLEKAGDLPPADMVSLQNIAGGPETYAEMMVWAEANAPDYFIERYDEVMGSSDVEEMEKAITILHGLYTQRTDEEVFEDKKEDAPMDEETIGVLQANEFVVSQFGGPQQYEAAMDFARQVLPQQVIDQYNQAQQTTDPNARVSNARALFETLSQIRARGN